MVRSGFNHSIPIDGQVFHVQTEHRENAAVSYIETEIFLDGQVVFSRRLDRSGPARTGAEKRGLDRDLRTIHKAVIARLVARDLPFVDGRAAERPAEDAHPPSSDAPHLAKVRPRHSPTQDRQLRRMLARFVRAVGEDEPKTVEALVRRIRSVTTAMAVVLGSSGNSYLRRDDLAELVMHRSEAAAYLSRSGSPDFGDGLALWRSFARLRRGFERINERRGLLELDLETLRKIRIVLDQEPEPEQRLAKRMVEQLALCAGRDPELDALLDAKGSLTAARACPVVDRLVEELGAELDSKRDLTDVRQGEDPRP